MESIKELKCGMAVKLRSGDYFLVFTEHLVNKENYIRISHYENNFNYNRNEKSEDDIIEVYEGSDDWGTTPITIIDFAYNNNASKEDFIMCTNMIYKEGDM